MADKKTGAAKHSADYRDRKKAEAERLGIETLPVESAAGTRVELAAGAAAGHAPGIHCGRPSRAGAPPEKT